MLCHSCQREIAQDQAAAIDAGPWSLPQANCMHCPDGCSHNLIVKPAIVIICVSASHCPSGLIQMSLQLQIRRQLSTLASALRCLSAFYALL